MGRPGAGRVLVALAGALAVTVALAGQGWAQALDGSTGLLPELDVRAKGWSQVKNIEEMLDFVLALVEIAVLTLAISLHPVNLHARRTKADYERPRTLFLYGLIGMTVGFLVLHHGYVIGFVVFGIGGLLRFRGESTSTQDTTRLILITLLGLTVGLDLPVVAFVAMATGWIAVYVFSQHEKLELEVKFNEKKNIHQSVDRLVEVLRERGFKTLGVSKTKFKPIVQFVVEGERGDQRGALMREMTDIQTSKAASVDDWHVG